MTEPRCVLAIDPLTSAASFARMIEGDPKPRLSYVSAPLVTTPRPSLADAVLRAQAQVADIMRKVETFQPELVIMPRIFVGNVTTDPSGPRRAGLYWMTVAALTDAGVPVADFPTLTAERYAGVVAQQGHKAVEKLAEQSKKKWPAARRDINPKYRWSTLMFAAVGCAAVGIPTKVAVTPTRLKLLKSGTWPESVTLATSIEDWKKKHGDDLELGEIGGDTDDTDDGENEQKEAS